MTTEEWHAFVCEGTRTGKLATTRADGRPHVTPVWIVLEGDDVVLTTGSDSVKAKTIRHEPRVSLVVDDQAPPYSYVMVEGVATLHDDLDEMLPIAIRIGARYMGVDRAEEFGRRNAVPGELLVRIRPSKVLAYADISA
jgi:hypothetical protein